MSISSIVDNLTETDREVLMLAFNNHKNKYIEYAPGLVIGVYDVPSNVKVTLQVRYWYLGELCPPQ